MKDNKPIVDSVHCHINNGGVSFNVTNECGPTVEIEASHFGHITNHIKLHIGKEGLKKLGDMFHQADQYDQFEQEYVCVAETNVLDKDTQKYKDKEPNVSHSTGTLGSDSNE